MWTRLLENEYVADPLVQFEMRKKLDLEKFQIEVSKFFYYSKALFISQGAIELLPTFCFKAGFFSCFLSRAIIVLMKKA